MTIEWWRDHMEHGDDIEFKYKNKNFSLTWGKSNGKLVLSFCEFNKDTVDCDTFDEIIEKEYHGEKIYDILLNTPNEEIDYRC